MTNKRFWLVMLVMALVFGMTVFGCDIDGNGKGNLDGNIDGVWFRAVNLTSEQPPHWIYCNNSIAILFQGGGLNPCNDCVWINETRTVTTEWVHELVFNDNRNFTMLSNETQYVKGTYSTNNGIITINPTHRKGLDSNFEKEWYSKNEMEEAFILLRSEGILGATDEDIERKLNDMYTSSTSYYSVKGNKLSISLEDEPQTFIKKNN